MLLEIDTQAIELALKSFVNHAAPSGIARGNGIDLPGMGPCQVDASSHVIRANKQIDLNPQSIDQWAEII